MDRRGHVSTIQDLARQGGGVTPAKLAVFVTHPAHKLAQYFGSRATQRLQAIADVRFNPEARDLSALELIAAAHDCDALIAYRQTPGPELLFRSLPRLAAFIRCAVDIRTVDVQAASQHGVLVTQASAGYVASVAEWVLAVMVDLARGTSRYAEAYHRDRPLVNTLPPFNGSDALVPTDLPVLLAQSDFVVCLAPANDQTENLMDAQAFASMQPGAFFINASRGELVDEDALLQVLDSGHLGGCALDVGRAPDQMPSLALARHPLVIATPHIGGLTLPAIEHQALETVAQLASLIQGKMPPGAVNAASATRLQKWNPST
jgi:D-3-phosphoglycerate dehydrogenase